MRMNERELVMSWIARVENEVAECQAAGLLITESDKKWTLLQGLTEAFATTKKVILTDSTRTGKVLSYAEIATVLMTDESTTQATTAATSYASQKPKGLLKQGCQRRL